MDPMQLKLDDEQVMMVETARRVGERFGLDYWRDKDRDKAFPGEIWKAICEAGLCGVALPEEYGGSGRGMFDMALVIETLCASGAGSTLAQLYMCNPIFGGVAISRYGQDWMKRDLLPGLIGGDLQFCMALTEPNAGSNTLEMRAHARPEGDGYRLNGQKIWITNVEASDYVLAVARTVRYEDTTRRTDGITLFLIETDRKGVSHSRIDKLGTNTLPSSSIFFEDVRLEARDVVGTVDGGWRQLLDVLNTERIVTTAGLVGTVDLALKLATEYARDRKVFGDTPIAAYQGLQFPLAQSYAENECARLMNRHAASLFDAGLPYGTEANVAKLVAAQTCSSATERAMQTMGGMGYAREFHVERLWRDCRLFRFAPVSEEMVLNYIAQHQLGMARSY
jgi:acyl-CoA dehydrogenase